ncbi:short-chain dehydrogenase [Sulfolobus sp. A20]|uniref:SDR family oxidoreductase n=1 Tax=Sulfolobaceae TaxID=118883 RepID=UPI0008460E57|nr:MULTISPECIES: SDR family oxidoreductase [unclassified Sulfolobus]TRM77907.1 SDR family NAD(P)-dependent oxidoreductase [Sulfolobus sp. B5]TRM77947.1 SDR family NAD(P)-dependent oxidoreductase [Sulfolobus sp. A20-N-F8]TRM80564.1 SDR family NAD(P)-dependent oxidoreductase [Sulfolobus sp. D5]TRM85126.1 SDR family NAD(P)-dependent oxidoreductase [Sulfolobus sp. F3]TRM87938.1 SDR family NAD(P)-dependent oxidoreductase [Sulfolobus sp. C3]TRM88818.1 SDR family NAD(P)-dependent oxidoreductase [Sul
MDLGIKGKKVLVTAASKGIGFATAKRFLEEGARVIISSHDEKNLVIAYEKLKETSKDIDYIKADLSNPNDVKNLIHQAYKKLDGLDVLAYVTGSPKPGNIFSLTDKDWIDAFNLLLMSAVVAVREAGQLMKSNGRIILSTSITLRQPIDNLDLSNVVRLSLAGLIRVASRELGPKGILVNGVMPGWTKTERVIQIAKDRAMRENRSEEEVLKDLAKSIPLGRLGEPEEIANVILFLASNLSTYITGTLILVDGGSTLGVF